MCRFGRIFRETNGSLRNDEARPADYLAARDLNARVLATQARQGDATVTFRQLRFIARSRPIMCNFRSPLRNFTRKKDRSPADFRFCFHRNKGTPRTTPGIAEVAAGINVVSDKRHRAEKKSIEKVCRGNFKEGRKRAMRRPQFGQLRDDCVCS